MDDALWRDREDRTWSTAITVNTIKRVKQLIGVDLLDVFDGQLLALLADDPVLLADTLYAVCKVQADERRVTDEAFGELLVGEAISEAATALVRGLIANCHRDAKRMRRPFHMADFLPADLRAEVRRTGGLPLTARNVRLLKPLFDKS